MDRQMPDLSATETITSIQSSPMRESWSTATMETLSRYHWPGNIREPQNVIERAVIISTGPELRLDFADLEERPAAPNSKPSGALRDVLGETERQQILQALKACNWVVAGPKGAASRLGIERSTLQLRIQKVGITRHSG
jgi:formate hydrogenlyase transcriptional activator